jgi:hypothetical protein
MNIYKHIRKLIAFTVLRYLNNLTIKEKARQHNYFCLSFIDHYLSYSTESQKNIDEEIIKYSKTIGKIFYIIIYLTKIHINFIMPETTCEKIKQHCLPFTYAFSFGHIKSVLIGMVTEYESKFLYSISRKICNVHFLFWYFKHLKLLLFIHIQ